MASSKSSTATQLPERLEPLARQLLELSPDDRDLVIRFVQANAPPRKLRGVPWERLKALEGVVSIGGNAVDDSAIRGNSVETALLRDP